MIKWDPFNDNLDLPLELDEMAEYLYNESFIVCENFDFTNKNKDMYNDIWECIKTRDDCMFTICFTNIEQLLNVLPSDWEYGYPNVILKFKSNIQSDITKFNDIKALNKTLFIDKIKDYIDISMCNNIQCVEISGDDDGDVICDFSIVKKIYEACKDNYISFDFISTGNKFKMNEQIYTINDSHRYSQAKKAGLFYKSQFKMQKNHKKECCNNCKKILMCKPGKNICNLY